MCQVYYNIYVLFCRDSSSKSIKVTIDVQHPDLIAVKPLDLIITNEEQQLVYVKGLNAGHSIVSANANSSDITE